MNKFLNKIKDKIFPISKLKLITFVLLVIFALFSYELEKEFEYKGFLFVLMFFYGAIFCFVLFILMLIRHYIATILFFIIAFLWIVWIEFLCGTFNYGFNKIKDPCYREENARWTGKGPMNYEILGRKCIGTREGDTYIYKTKK